MTGHLSSTPLPEDAGRIEGAPADSQSIHGTATAPYVRRARTCHAEGEPRLPSSSVRSVRDDFKAPVKKLLAARVGYVCSNPDCGALTSGPATDPSSSINVGVAAHITAASPGGARYDPLLTEAERSAAANGIWVCEKCAKLIDADALGYPVALLQRWKVEAEDRAAKMVTTGLGHLTAPLRLTIPEIESNEELLLFANTALPHVGREGELDELRRFLEAEASFQWWLWTGPAGVGKSRLAVEFCRVAPGSWNVGFLHERDQARLSDLQPASPTFVVIDYVAQRAAEVSDALLALAQRRSPPPIRVLLLEREARGVWWDTVQRLHRLEESARLASCQYALPRDLTGLSRPEVREVIRSVAGRLRNDLARWELEPIVDHAFEIDEFGRPLFAVVAALDYLGESPSKDRDEALRRLIAREEARLAAAADPDSATMAKNAQLIGTVVGGVSVEQYVAALENMPVATGLLPAAHQASSHALDQLLEGLKPDLLGELMVLDQIGGTDARGLVVRQVVSAAAASFPNAYQAFVERASVDHREHPSLSHLIDAAQGSGPTGWAVIAAGVIPLLGRSDHPLLEPLLVQLAEMADVSGDEDVREGFLRARWHRGNLLLSERRWSEANSIYTEVLPEVSVGHSLRSDILNNRGIAWLELGEETLAVADFSAVVENAQSTNEARACALNNRADIFERDQLTAAIADRTNVLSLADTSYNRRFIALVRRAQARKRLGDEDRALEDIRTILTTEDIATEQKMNARLVRAKWLIESDLVAAREDLEAVLDSHHNFPKVAIEAKRLLDALRDVPDIPA